MFVQNLAPGAAARMGQSAEVLRGRDQRLIVCDVSGYAPAGPLGDRRAYDLLIQCETGLLSVTGTQDAPAKAGISVADIAGGMYAFSSVSTGGAPPDLGPIPAVGEHTDAILAELGLTDAEVAALRSSGMV